MVLSELSIRRPVLATVMSLVVALVGLIGYGRLTVREYPKIDEPVVTVDTTFKGASSDIIESQVTQVMEESLSGIETVRATSAEARMQTGWERSIAATARSGEDVQFWAGLALTSANTAQQLCTMLMMVVGVPRRGYDAVDSPARLPELSFDRSYAGFPGNGRAPSALPSSPWGTSAESMRPGDATGLPSARARGKRGRTPAVSRISLRARLLSRPRSSPKLA